MKKFWCALLIFITLFLCFGLSGCSKSTVKETAQALNGTMDVTDWDIESDGIISLNGPWEFYWKQFLTSSEMLDAEPDLLVQVPSTWNEYSLDGQRLPGEGYGTYRLHVKTGLLQGKILGLRIQTFSSAYRLFVDDKLVAQNGNISSTASEEVGEYKPQAVFFSAPSNEFDIIIQVSNHQYARGGFWCPVYIGSQSQIAEFSDSILMKNMFVIGAFLIVALFYIASFFLMKENKANLFFGLLCLFAIMAYDTSGQLALSKTITGISLNTVIFIWYSSCIWVEMFVLLYMNELFESRFSRIIIKVFAVVVIALQLLYTLAPTQVYTAFGRIGNYIEDFCMFSAAIIAIMGAIKRKKNGWLNLISLIILLVTVVHDTLYYTNVIKSSHGEILYVGLFAFLLIQMLIKAISIKDYYENKNTAELKFLQAQIKPHFLYNSINTFISVSRYDPDRARELMADFSEYLRKSFDFKGTGQLVLLKDELKLTQAYLNIEQARFEERVEVSFEFPENQEVMVPSCMLQPVVENAIIHGILPKPEGGRIDIRVKDRGGALRFSVKDDGVGINPQEIPHITEKYTNGVGLANISQRLSVLYGKKLRIKSEVGKGTEVSWEIPRIARKRRKSD